MYIYIWGGKSETSGTCQYPERFERFARPGTFAKTAKRNFGARPAANLFVQTLGRNICFQLFFLYLPPNENEYSRSYLYVTISHFLSATDAQ